MAVAMAEAVKADATGVADSGILWYTEWLQEISKRGVKEQPEP